MLANTDNGHQSFMHDCFEQEYFSIGTRLMWLELVCQGETYFPNCMEHLLCTDRIQMPGHLHHILVLITEICMVISSLLSQF